LAFGKLTNLATGPMVKKVADQIAPVLEEQLKTLPALGASKLRDEEFFKQFAVTPAWLAVESATSGLTKLYPPIEEKFGALMVHLRDELLIFDADTVTIVEDVKEKIVPAVIAGLQQQA